MEVQLFEHLFPGSGDAAAALAPLLDPLCTLLYEALRPPLLQLQDLDELCRLHDILHTQVAPVLEANPSS